MTTGKQPDTFGAFITSQALWKGGGLGELSLQDIGEIQLLLRGQSVIDWHRLAMTSEEDVRRLAALNSLDLDDPGDAERVAELRQQAARYIVEVLKLRLDESIAEKTPWVQIPLIASGKGGGLQRQQTHLGSVAVRDHQLVLQRRGRQRPGGHRDVRALPVDRHRFAAPLQRVAPQCDHDAHLPLPSSTYAGGRSFASPGVSDRRWPPSTP